MYYPDEVVEEIRQKNDIVDFVLYSAGNENGEVNKATFVVKLKKENFKIPLIINGKVTNTFKTLNKAKNFYVEYEDLVEFNSVDIAKQIEDEKEIIRLVKDWNIKLSKMKLNDNDYTLDKINMK